MNPLYIGLIGLIVLFFLMFVVELPIGVCMGLVAFAGFGVLISGNAAMVKMGIIPFALINTYDFAVIPLFVLMAQICFVSGIGSDLYNLLYKWLGFLPGGLAVTTIAGCGVLAAINSSSAATEITMATVALPEMKKYKYDIKLALGSITAGGTLGILIPPSSFLILYGIITQTSIGKLFAAGILPGISQMLFYIIVIFILCRINPALGPKGPKFSFKERIFAFKNCGEIIALIILVLGGLIIGWFTPTEAGAVGVFGATLFCLIRRRLNLQKFIDASIETVNISGMVFLILLGALLFNYFIAVTTIPTWISDTVSGLAIPPMGVILVIIVMYMILGTAMEEASMMMLTIPILFPLVMNLGFDALWFGIIVTRMMEIAMISPPIGMNLFVMQGISNEPMQKIYRGVVPFICADIVNVALLLAFPAISLFIPSFMK